MHNLIEGKVHKYCEVKFLFVFLRYLSETCGQDSEMTNGLTGTIYWITIIKKQIIEASAIG